MYLIKCSLYKKMKEEAGGEDYKWHLKLKDFRAGEGSEGRT